MAGDAAEDIGCDGDDDGEEDGAGAASGVEAFCEATSGEPAPSLRPLASLSILEYCESWSKGVASAGTCDAGR